jgi:alcohol dehydrogenase class IV
LVSFDFCTATQVRVGSGVRHQVGAAVIALGARSVLVVTGRNPDRAAALIAELEAHGVAWVAFTVAEEPTVDLVREGVRAVAEASADAVVAIGGGSALDAGKAIAVIATNGGDPLDYLEVVGAGRKLVRAPLPFIAMPTTAGTGSEVTRNAVLSVPSARVKASLRSTLMLPRLAVVDPDLLATAPRSVIAGSGLDALSQVIEPFLSSRANPITDSLARDGIRRSARALRRAYEVGVAGDATADVREDLALGSLLGGLCLANAGLGAVHGFAAAVGGMFGAPHGAVCAALLPHVLGVNLRALRAREPAHPTLARMLELAHLLTGAPLRDIVADDGITFVVELCRTLDIPGLGRYGMTAADIPELVEKAKSASSMKGNPLPLSERELTEIAERALC